MNRRNARTLLLAILATATFIWSAIYHFDIPAQEMAWLGLYTAAGVLTIALLAALTVASLHGIRYLWRRFRR